MRSIQIPPFFVTPVAMLALTAVLCEVAHVLTLDGPDHARKLMIFPVVCLVAFHVACWALRKTTDEKSVKLFDYLYLGLGLLGLYGALDVQAAMYRSRIPEALDAHRPGIELSPWCATSTYEENCGAAYDLRAMLKDRVFDYRLFQRTVDAVTKYEPSDAPEAQKHFNEMMKSLSNDIEKQGFPFGKSSENDTNRNRIFAFYLLAVGLSLRITKVTVEVRKWVSKPEGTSQPVLPTAEVGGHNAV